MTRREAKHATSSSGQSNKVELQWIVGKVLTLLKCRECVRRTVEQEPDLSVSIPPCTSLDMNHLCIQDFLLMSS